METNNISWESHKPNWQSQIRAHNLKRERTQSEETQSLVNARISGISKPKQKLESLKPTINKLEKLKKELRNQELLKGIKKALSNRTTKR